MITNPVIRGGAHLPKRPFRVNRFFIFSTEPFKRLFCRNEAEKFPLDYLADNPLRSVRIGEALYLDLFDFGFKSQSTFLSVVFREAVVCKAAVRRGAASNQALRNKQAPNPGKLHLSPVRRLPCRKTSNQPFRLAAFPTADRQPLRREMLSLRLYSF